jgi:pimeloyl-ACP methyl ester carboxylesterase
MMLHHMKTLMVAAAVLVPGRAVLAQAGTERLLWVDGQAGRLRVSDGGSGGTPVLFVHSLAGNRQQWSNQLAHLRGNRRAVAFDLRGHGESDRPSGADYSLEGAAADIETVANRLGLDRFILVGHSFGGGAVATYAGAHPERVAGLFFVDPIGDQRSARTQVDMLVQMLQSPAYQSAAMMYYEAILVNATPDVRGQVLAALGQTSQEALVKAFASIVEFDPTEALQPYSGPMFNVISDLNEFPASLHNIIPNLPTERMAGTSHWLHMDRPEEFNSHLDVFLAGKH